MCEPNDASLSDDDSREGWEDRHTFGGSSTPIESLHSTNKSSNKLLSRDDRLAKNAEEGESLDDGYSLDELLSLHDQTSLQHDFKEKTEEIGTGHTTTAHTVLDDSSSSFGRIPEYKTNRFDRNDHNPIARINPSTHHASVVAQDITNDNGDGLSVDVSIVPAPDLKGMKMHRERVASVRFSGINDVISIKGVPLDSGGDQGRESELDDDFEENAFSVNDSLSVRGLDTDLSDDDYDIEGHERNFSYSPLKDHIENADRLFHSTLSKRRNDLMKTLPKSLDGSVRPKTMLEGQLSEQSPPSMNRKMTT